ncbi:MAG: TldD/PmbA family protein [Candidatus Asgardarchaeia archaeon]
MDYDKNYLQAIAERIVEKALVRGIDDAEAFVYAGTTTEVQLRGHTTKVHQLNPIGVGIRVVKGKKIGFSSTSSLEDDAIDKAIENAVTLAKFTPDDNDFISLPKPIKRASKDGIIDKEVIEYPMDEFLKSATKLRAEMLEYDKRIKVVEGGFEKGYEIFAVANSQGISDYSENAGIGGWLYGVAKTETEIKTGFDFIASRTIPDFSTIAINAAKRTVECFGAKKLEEKMKIPVIIENRPLSTLLTTILSFGLSGRNVMLKSSYYSDKEGQKVASKKLTLIDDGQLPEGLNTTKIDHEGITKTTNIIIEEGILKSFLFDSYSAYKLNKVPTGNASRAGRGSSEPFNNSVDVSFNNIVIQEGTKDFQSFIESFDQAIVVKTMILGGGHANRSTGDFSVVAPNAFLWKNGTLTPLKSITLAGNLYKVLETIVDIGGDATLLPSGKIPSIAFENITVA